MALWCLASGAQAGASSWINGTSGAWNIAGNWSDGLPDSDGIAIINNSGIALLSVGVSGTYLQLVVGADGVGALQVNRGRLTGSSAFLGNEAGSTGIASVVSGTWSNAADLYVGNLGSGTLTLTGGLVQVSGTVYMGSGTGSQGTINLNGGVLSANRVMKGEGSGVIRVNGGTLQARGNESDFLSGYDAGNVTIGPLGAFINTSTFSIGISTALSGTGILVKEGLGTLTLASSNYSGTTMIRSGTIAVVGSTLDQTNADMLVGSLNGQNGSLRFDEATVTSRNIYLGRVAGASGAAEVSSGTWNYNAMAVGYFGSGTMNITSSLVAGGAAYIGYEEGSNGAVTFNSGTWSNFSEMSVGEFGTGTLEVNGGLVSTHSTFVGSYEGSKGTVTVNGGTWSNIGTIYLGYGGSAAVNISSGLVTSSTAFVGMYGTASVLVTGGTWTNSQEMRVGQNATGELAISGGRVAIGGSLLTGGAERGTINLSGSGVLSLARFLKISTSSIIFNGGTLEARNNETLFLSGYATGDVEIREGGAHIDTKEFAISIGSPMTGTGALTKLGSGTLTLSGSNSYSGGTFLKNGTLLATSPYAVGAGAVTMESGVFQMETRDVQVSSITLAGGSVIQKLGVNTYLSTRPSMISDLADGIRTQSNLLDGRLRMSATLVSSFSATSSAANDAIRLSDVFHFAGLPEILGQGLDPFVLQLTVTGLAAGSYLGWLDTEINLWVNAVDGNVDPLSMPIYFARAYNPATDFVLGYYGFDADTGQVWAVLDHNSDFAAVPEPGTWALLLLGGAVLLASRRLRGSARQS